MLDYGSSTILSTLTCISEIALHAPAVFEPHHATIIRDFVVKTLLGKDRVGTELVNHDGSVPYGVCQMCDVNLLTCSEFASIVCRVTSLKVAHCGVTKMNYLKK